MKQFSRASKVGLLLLALALPAVAQKSTPIQFHRGEVKNFATIPAFSPSGVPPGTGCPKGPPHARPISRA